MDSWPLSEGERGLVKSTCPRYTRSSTLHHPPTYGSCLYEIDYALPQDHGGGKYQLVQCDSRFLTDAVSCYATIELELLALVLAMSNFTWLAYSTLTSPWITDPYYLFLSTTHWTPKRIPASSVCRRKFWHSSSPWLDEQTRSSASWMPSPVL